MEKCQLARLCRAASGPVEAILVLLHPEASGIRHIEPLMMALAPQLTVFALEGPRHPRGDLPASAGLPQEIGRSWIIESEPGMIEPNSLGQALFQAELFLLELQADHTGHERLPLILAGMGQGATVALSLAVLHAGAVSGVIAFDGYLPDMPVSFDAPPGAPVKLKVSLNYSDRQAPQQRLRGDTVAKLEALGAQYRVNKLSQDMESVISSMASWMIAPDCAMPSSPSQTYPRSARSGAA